MNQTPKDDIIERLRRTAAELADLSPREVGAVGYLLGATYALIDAYEHRFLAGDAVDDQYADELRSTARALSAGGGVRQIQGLRVIGKEHIRYRGAWLAGFHFNSALYHIAAGAERLRAHPKYNFQEPEILKRVREDVNNLKHEGKGLTKRRRVASIDGALQALECLIDHWKKTRVRRGS